MNQIIKAYRIKYYLAHQGTEYRCYNSLNDIILLDESCVKEEQNLLDWEDIERFCDILPFDIQYCAKGRKIIWHNVGNPIEEWETKHLFLLLTKEYEPYPNITFTELMKQPAEQVIQYIKERL